MKPSKFTEIKVGIFVVIILFLFGVGIFAIGSHQKYFQRQYTLWASFSNIKGLIVGAPVRLAGLTVGRVNAILFPEDPAAKTITVELKITKALRRGLGMTLSQASRPWGSWGTSMWRSLWDHRTMLSWLMKPTLRVLSPSISWNMRRSSKRPSTR